MKVSIFFLIIYSFLFCTAAPAQENWDTYMAKFGEKPGSVLVDMGWMAHAPDRRYQYLVITGPQALNCNGQGLPDKEEIDALEEILSATSNFITGVTAKVLTGTFTYNCERLNYYYVKDTIGIRNAIMRLYNHSYKNYHFALNMKYDPEWTTYSTFLYPNEETLKWMENTRIITKIMQDGDSLTKQRDINFDFFFKSDTDRKTFADFARIKGYKDRFVVSQSTVMPYELIVSKYAYVKTDLLLPMIDELKAGARKYHGLYNGWEAPLKH